MEITMLSRRSVLGLVIGLVAGPWKRVEASLLSKIKVRKEKRACWRRACDVVYDVPMADKDADTGPFRQPATDSHMYRLMVVRGFMRHGHYVAYNEYSKDLEELWLIAPHCLVWCEIDEAPPHKSEYSEHRFNPQRPELDRVATFSIDETGPSEA